MSKQKVDIILINPPNRKTAYGSLNKIVSLSQPVGIAVIAACCMKEGLTCKIIDADAEDLSFDGVVDKLVAWNPKLIGITTMTPIMTSVEELLKKIAERAPNILRVLGGFHATALPERTLREMPVDFIVRGEGVVTFPELFKAYKEGGIEAAKKIKGLSWLENNVYYESLSRELVSNLDTLPMAAWDLLPMEKYRSYYWHGWGHKRIPYAVIYSSLGCPHRCKFCAVHITGGRKTRFRSPENFIAEIDYLVSKYKVKTYWIKDDTFNLDKERVKKICQLLIERNYNLNIYVYTRPEGLDIEICKLMSKAGFRWLSFGVEVGTQKMLDNINKNTTHEKLKNAFNMVQGAGMHVAANYIMGFPEDTEESCLETIRVAKKLNADYSWFGLLSPYPGTELYNNALEQNLPLPEKWGDFGHYTGSAITMGTLSSEQLIKLRKKGHLKTQLSFPYMKLFIRRFGFRSFIKDYSSRLWITLNFKQG